MTVFLGDAGRILLERKATDEPLVTLVNASDVRPDVNRFSVDFAYEQIITGDRLEISTVDGEDLNWIDDSTADNSFTRFVHVDAAGGIRFYDTFSEAIRGELAGSINLTTPTKTKKSRSKLKVLSTSAALLKLPATESQPAARQSTPPI